jgi:integrase
VGVSEPKTAASARVVTVPAFVIDELAAHMTQFPPNDEGYIFTTEGETVINSSNFGARVWRPLVTKLGLEGFRFHDLRHSHAAHLIEQGSLTPS